MAALFFYMFILLKQFYILDSGYIGIGDLCLSLCALCLFWRNYNIKKCKEELMNEKYLYGFLCAVIIINGIFSLKNRQWDYIRYTLYWIYNIAAIWCFQTLSNRRFLKNINMLFKMNIILQMLVYLTGYGRVFHEYWGGTRYMGTFNDPNQFAFFIFSMLLLIAMYAYNFGDRLLPIFYVMAFWLVSMSKSTGVFAGILILTLGMVINIVVCHYKSSILSNQFLIFAGVIVGVFAIILLRIIIPPFEFNIQDGSYSIISRIQEKVWKVIYGSGVSLLGDRGLDRIFIYPQYLLWGAGEGGFERFDLLAYQNELHSSFFSIWFCYGIGPLIIMLRWFHGKLRNLSIGEWSVICALIIESCFLINYRQPFFWMIIVYRCIVRKYDIGNDSSAKSVG